MVPASLGFMFLTCLGIDLVRQVRRHGLRCNNLNTDQILLQRHMKYKARQIVLLRNIKRHTGTDLRELNFQDKLSGILSEKFLRN